MDSHGPRVEGALISPHAIHQLIAREHLPRIRCKEYEQVQLLQRQPEQLTTLMRLTGPGVDHDVAEGDRLRCAGARLRRAANEVAHSNRELAGRERLSEIVVGPEFEADDPIGLL